MAEQQDSPDLAADQQNSPGVQQPAEAPASETKQEPQKLQDGDKVQEDGQAPETEKAPANGHDGANGSAQVAPKHGYDEKKTDGDQEQNEDKKKDGDKKQGGDDKGDKKPPPGGFDDTPIPSPGPGIIGYTVKFTFHRATSLPMGDAPTLSSDPYVLAQLNTDIPKRHKEDPYLRWRTSTVRRNAESPSWEEDWIVANVPSNGFKLKLRVYDEDPADHDDLLGIVHITVPSLNDNWQGMKNEKHELKFRRTSRRALLVRGIARCFRYVHEFRGDLFLSIELLGRTGEDGQNGRPYTLGPCRWIRHYSALLGRIAHTREPSNDDDDRQPSTANPKQKKVEKYSFQANEFQLQGPVPKELYHRFVEFSPWVSLMFTHRKLQGMILGKALHHQHNRVYNYDRVTKWGTFPDGPSEDMTRKFLDLVHYDRGGRVFTYVITLDAFFRFTETGPEFGIDMLSKHTMHSDVSIYIAFSGEFFIRRLKHKHRPPPPDPSEETSQQTGPTEGASNNDSHPPHDLPSGPPSEDPPRDPAYFEIVIDNDSGTYRPNAKMLPILAGFLARNFPGLHVRTLDCQADADRMARMKSEQRERKKAEGDGIVYAQADGDDSSISSSDDERLDDVHQNMHQGQNQSQGRDQSTQSRFHGGGTTKMVINDAKLRHQSRIQKAKRTYGGRARDSREGIGDEADREVTAAA